jgi:LacI family transcriptional regulator
LPPTLRDIARRTGIDVSTISRVLNNDTSRGVSQRKREQILAVAEQIGYRPHRYARALRTGRHMNVAYVLVDSPAVRSNLELPFARFRLYGMEEVLTARSYLLSLLRLDPEDPRSFRDRVLRAGQVDGLLFNFATPSPAVIDLIREARLPVVVVDGDVFEQSAGAICCVLSDREGGMYASVSHLIAHGHGQIALVNADVNRQRRSGYLRALREAGLPADERLIWSWSDRDGTLSTAREKGYQAARTLLARGVLFTAVQAGSDSTAVGVIEALRGAGRRVPEEVAVAGFDNVDEMGFSPFHEPFLTTVDDPNQQMGRRAAELLLAQIEDGAEPQRIVLPTRLVVRQSCGEHREDSPAAGSATEVQ